RGAGPSLPFSRLLYQAGCSSDVRAAAQDVLQTAPGSPLLMVGFSMGGNIVLKLAGEAALDPLPGLAGIAAVSPPIDLVRCCALLGSPRNRFYDRHYVRCLVSQVRRHLRLFPDQPQTEFPRALSLRQFDDLYTAPRWGFADALDYYRKASALPVVPRIDVPA